VQHYACLFDFCCSYSCFARPRDLSLGAAVVKAGMLSPSLLCCLWRPPTHCRRGRCDSKRSPDILHVSAPLNPSESTISMCSAIGPPAWRPPACRLRLYTSPSVRAQWRCGGGHHRCSGCSRLGHSFNPRMRTPLPLLQQPAAIVPFTYIVPFTGSRPSFPPAY
jgi:hypothetical protein